MDAYNSFQIDFYFTNLSLMSLIVKRFSVCLYGIKWVIPLSYNAHIHALNRCGAWLCRKGAALKTRRAAAGQGSAARTQMRAVPFGTAP